MQSPEESRAPESIQTIPFWLACAPVLLLVALLLGCVSLFGDETTSGPGQVALMLSGFLAALIALASRQATWSELEMQVLRTTGFVTQAILILLLVGGLIGTWILGGIVPTLIVWGLRLIAPEVFLLAALGMSALVSLATGSSWSTAGTLGLALVGVGNAMQIDPAMTAGAVISGAYFGDKMSPFSETTNLASSMVAVDLFAHIRHMLATTVPGFVFAAIFFTVLGLRLDLTSAATGDDLFEPDRIQSVIVGIESIFETSPVMLLPPLILFVLVARRMPAIPALMIALLLGAFFALLFQAKAVGTFAGGAAENGVSEWLLWIRATGNAAATGYVASTGVENVDSLLSRGGMASMLNTVWLILSAMFFSGIMEGSGFLQRIAAGVLYYARGAGHLVAATLGTAGFLNFSASDQYLSLVVTGRMYREAYVREGLEPENLSRALEDGGTLSSALIPWNTCGAFMASTLGVATLSYLPYAVLNWSVPLISLIYGYTGFTITRSRAPAAPVDARAKGLEYE